MMKKKKRSALRQLKIKGKPVSESRNPRKSEVEQAVSDNEGGLTIRSLAMDRAQDIRAKLSSEFPSFLKPVHRSNVAGRFCLYLPKQFCDDHLPNHDDNIVLVDENDEEYHVNYVLLRNKLDGGWRGFSNVHNLMEGDALVFHLMQRCKFKVYIVRAPKVNGTLGLLNSGSHAKPIDTDRVGDKSDKFHSNIQEGIQCPVSIFSFKDMKCFDDFQIRVGNLILDPEIPGHLRKKYYKLCCSQEMFLHQNLIENLNIKLVVGMISETTNIAEAIRAANLTASLQNLKHWDKTLEALEGLGMSVSFLRTRLDQLIQLATEFKAISELKRKRRALLEDDDLKDLKATFVKAKVLMDGIEAEVEALEVKNKKLRCDFKEIAAAPW